MMKQRRTLFLVAVFLGCGAGALYARLASAQKPPYAPPVTVTEEPGTETAHPETEADTQTSGSSPSGILEERDYLVAAEQNASGGARRVLSTARTLIDDGVVIRGTCYTWLNAVYTRAGGRRSTAFNGSRRGPYANTSLLRPGDWIHFINHSYGGVTHSAIFVAWIDEESKRAITVSYPGERRNEPGRFKEYELTSVYRIDRMADVEAVASR
jgi:hypothetical protein